MQTGPPRKAAGPPLVQEAQAIPYGSHASGPSVSRTISPKSLMNPMLQSRVHQKDQQSFLFQRNKSVSALSNLPMVSQCPR